ncbi:MAG: type II and III secretion system protein family protein [Terriglobia bacterium]
MHLQTLVAGPSQRFPAGRRHIAFCWIVLLAWCMGSIRGLSAQQAPQGDVPGELHVLVGRTLVLNSPTPLIRISIADPAIAEALVISPTQVQINGRVPGAVSLVLWDETNQSQTFDLYVDLDILSISQNLRGAFPDEPIQLEATKDLVTVSGVVSSEAVADRIMAFLTAATPKVVSLLQVPQPPTVGEIMLQVRFAEVDRAALDEFGFNLMSFPGSPLKILGSTSTQQFGTPVFGGFGGATGGSGFEFSDLLNVFVFRPDVEMAGLIRAMRQQNLLQILAEPNLITQTGKEASFLAGGEFPVPIVQPGATFGISIIFKEFGVRLNFTPTLQLDGRIHLKVTPEVSSLDFANALTISGFVIPALSTRRVNTEMDLADGQSFAIAGLVDDRLTQTVRKVPGLGDIPILGKLFQSTSKNAAKSELLVVVTPKIVRPVPVQPLPAEPQFPEPFLPPAGPPAPTAAPAG